jgi:hypothetical protein
MIPFIEQRYIDGADEFSSWTDGLSRLVERCRSGDRALRLLLINSPVSMIIGPKLTPLHRASQWRFSAS